MGLALHAIVFVCEHHSDTIMGRQLQTAPTSCRVSSLAIRRVHGLAGLPVRPPQQSSLAFASSVLGRICRLRSRRLHRGV